jgi:hypothetical protein
MSEIWHDCCDCEHWRSTYYEPDTGYEEGKCDITGYEPAYPCPLDCKYKVINDD